MRRREMINIFKLKNDLKTRSSYDLLTKVLNCKSLKAVILDMGIHFSMDKDYNPWPLGYIIYQESSGLSEIEFNILLESLNYKLFYDRNSGIIVFKPRK